MQEHEEGLQAALGTMMLGSARFAILAAPRSPTMQFALKHSDQRLIAIWDAIARLCEARQEVDLITVSEDLRARDAMPEPSYLANCVVEAFTESSLVEWLFPVEGARQ